ncbi:TPA: hypothetical protein IAA87_01425 [Candidatus Avigastranaerophilus faecigallinarum]|nr:hypothetical protein [Candidatus Avigastranaerophilus faecigallinarum]
MLSNISFGSIFNPERVGRKNIEDVVDPEQNPEKLNMNQDTYNWGRVGGKPIEDMEFGKVRRKPIENMEFGRVGKEPIEDMEFGRTSSKPLENFIDSGLGNPERNIEKLKYGQEIEPSKLFSITPQALLGRSQVKMPKRKNPAEPNDEDKKLLSKLSMKKYGFYENSNEFWIHSNTKKEDGTHSFTLGDGKLQENITRADFIKGLVTEDVQGFNISGVKKDGSGKLSATFIHDKETGFVTIYSSDYDQEAACLECYGFEDFKTAINSLIDSLDTIIGATIWQ